MSNMVSRFLTGILLATLVTAVSMPSSAQQNDQAFADGQVFLQTYCKSCHQGKSPAGGFDVERISTPATLGAEPKWNNVISRVKSYEMPPKSAPSPDIDVREKFAKWAENAVRAQVCA